MPEFASGGTDQFLEGLRRRIQVRLPTESEQSFFRTRPDVAGYAAPDDRVVPNLGNRLYDPIAAENFLQSGRARGKSLADNERVRIFLRNIHPKDRPTFDLTPEQLQAFKNYGGPQDIRDTIVSRLMTGDSSGGTPTTKQSEWVGNISKADRGLQRVQALLQEHSDKNFVQRILHPKNYPSIDLGEGYHGTHLMSWATVGDKAIVYPTIIQDPETGELKRLNQKEAMDTALRTKEFIKFNTPEEADWFSKNYKRVWNQGE